MFTRIYIVNKPNAAILTERLLYHNGRFRCEPMDAKQKTDIDAVMRITLLEPLPIECPSLLSDVKVLKQLTKPKQ